jgi:hypothetical protein
MLDFESIVRFCRERTVEVYVACWYRRTSAISTHGHANPDGGGHWLPVSGSSGVSYRHTCTLDHHTFYHLLDQTKLTTVHASSIFEDKAKTG